MACSRILIRSMMLCTAAASFALALLWMRGCGNNRTAATNPASATEQVMIAGEEFTLELAADDSKRELGLKHRDHIPDHGGMLFVFPDSKVRVQSFWMHECLVDMDIIFLDPRGRVTALHRMKAQAPKRLQESEQDYQDRMRAHSYPSGYPAQFAIELKAGSLDRLNLKFDDKIQLDLPRLKAMAR